MNAQSRSRACDPYIRQIVGRAHVSWSNRRVIRSLISCLEHDYASWRKLERATRRSAMRDVIAEHRNNRALYDFVMRGRKPPRARRA